VSVYWIGRARTRDPVGYKKYGEIVTPLKERYPVEVLARGGRHHVLEGADTFDRYVVLRFPSMEMALEYYNTPEYTEGGAIRRAASDAADLVLVEGV